MYEEILYVVRQVRVRFHLPGLLIDLKRSSKRDNLFVSNLSGYTLTKDYR